jgi:UDP-N-acetylglucosamine 2-epimerase (non-hydrolysing)
MNKKIKIIHTVGARPNFMKVAPLIRELGKDGRAENILVHTGQHYDAQMSDVFFEELRIPQPDINLEVGSGSHAEQTAQVMLRFEPVVNQGHPDWVVVYGDVNSTLACSLVACKLGVPVAHVEAGVRSFDRSMPEEINRVLTDAIATQLFTPSRDANVNLQKEGVAEERVYFVGNIMVDTLLASVDIARERRVWQRWQLKPQAYAVLTLHRVSNVDDETTLKNLITAIRQIAQWLPIVFPVHPRTAKRFNEFGLMEVSRSASEILGVEPLGYLDFLCLVSQAKMVLTDSGSLQAETTMLGVPCLTLRKNTEWHVTVDQGTNHMVGTDVQNILSQARLILDEDKKPDTMPELWDGKTAQRIAKVMLGSD